MTVPNTGTTNNNNAPAAETHVPIGTSSDGTLVLTPQTGQPLSATDAASAAARVAIAERGTALPTTPANPLAPPAGEVREVAQPRASDGTFGRPLPDGTQPAAAAADAAAAKPDAAPATGQAPAGDEATPAGDAEAEALAARTVALTLADGAALDLDVGDPAVAEVLRSQMETAREADTIRTQAEATIAEVTAIREHIQIDPVGFALRELRESPAGQKHLALSLLAQPELFAALKPTLDAMLADPDKYELVRAQQVAARSTYAEQARQQVEEGRAVQQNVRDVQTVCGAMARLLPNEAAATTAYNDMLRDLMHYADQANVQTIEPDMIPAILARRLTALGLDPVVAAQAGVKARSSKGAAPARRTAQATPQAPSAGQAPQAKLPPAPKPTGTDFVAAQQRRAAVAIPAAGAGSPNVGPDLVPPKNPDGSPMTIAQTTAWHRDRVAAGKRGIAPVAAAR